MFIILVWAAGISGQLKTSDMHGSIRHIDDMAALFEGIPLDQMNTSMTINATAPWLLALYIAVAERCDIAPEMLSGTVQNDIIKEYLARGTYIFPPAASMN